MGWLDFMTPQRSAPTQQAQAQAPATSSAGPSNSAAQSQSGGGGGVMGWFSSAGSWVADKWDSATSAVSGFAQRTGQVAKDLWDVASTTDLSWKDGKLAIDTDLDEVMDLMPESVRSSLQLDRENSQNRVKLEFDRTTGAFTASSDDLRVKSVNTSKLKTGPVHLQGAKITLSNPGGGIPGLDDGFQLFGYQDSKDNLQASLQMDAMQAEDIELQGKDGPVSVKSVQTGGLRGSVSSQQGMPFSDKGSSSAGFSVEKAVVKGLSGAGVGADELSVERAEAGISEGSETAFLETTGLAVKNGRQGERRLGDASVDHARVDVANQGGGAIFLDDAEDHMTARVAISAAGVHDFQGGDQRVGSASVGGVTGTWSQDTGSITANANDLKASKVDTAGVDVGDVDLDGVKVELGPQGEGKKLDLRADKARVDDLAVDPATQGGGSEAKNSSPLAFHAGLGSLELNRARIGKDSVNTLNARELNADGALDNKGLSLKAALGRADVQGVDTQFGTLQRGSLTDARLGMHGGDLDASLGGAELEGLDALDRAHVAKASLSQLTASSEHGQLRAGLGRLEASGATVAGQGSVDHLLATDLSGSRIDGVTQGDLGHLGVEGLNYQDKARLDSLTLDAVHASNAGGRTEARFADAGLDGLNVNSGGTPGHLGSLRATDGKLSMQDGAIVADAATAAAQDLSYADVSAAELATKNLHASIDREKTALGADGVQIDRFNSKNFSADRLSATGAQATMSGDEYQASLDSARAEKARIANRLDVELASAEGLTSSVRGDHRSMSLDAAHLAGVKDEPTQSSLKTGDLSGLSLENDSKGTRASLDQLTLDQLRSGQNSAGRVSLSGLEGEQTDQALSAKLRSGSVDKVAVHGQGTDASVEHLGTEGANLRLDQRGLDASLGQLTATDARFAQKGLGGGGSTGASSPLALDQGQLIRTLSASVDDASLSASAPLRAGEIPGAPVSIKQGTTMNANLGIQDGAFTRDTRVSLSENLDAPLWVGVAGAYIDEKGRLMADVRGWSDQNVSKSLNKGLGIQGDRMPNLATLGDAVADKMEAPSTKAPSSGSSPSAADIVDLDRLHANAKIGFRPGTIDAGPVGSLTLGSSQNPQANTLLAEMSGRDRVVAGFSDLLATAFKVDANGNQIQGGRGELVDARVAADLNGSDAGIQGSLGSADLRDLRLRSSNLTLPAEKKKQPSS